MGWLDALGRGACGRVQWGGCDRGRLHGHLCACRTSEQPPSVLLLIRWPLAAGRGRCQLRLASGRPSLVEPSILAPYTVRSPRRVALLPRHHRSLPSSPWTGSPATPRPLHPTVLVLVLVWADPAVLLVLACRGSQTAPSSRCLHPSP